MRSTIAATCALLLTLVAVPAAGQDAPPVPTPLTAGAELAGPDGQIVGRATLEETPFGGVLITLSVEGLEPGSHGFHIHETGRCEAPDFTSAGGHYAPRGNAHGLRTAWGHHGGDLPNLHVAEDGTARTERLASGVTLRADAPHTLFDADGSAIVLHAGPDDYVSQPSGAAGARVACGVIQR